MDKNPTTRFSDRVEHYVRYRPGYPTGILSFLETELGFKKKSLVADVGSGTGILTRLFLENGNRVFAVEPNDAMRQAAEVSLENYPGFTSITGRAEQTGLPDASVDLITAGQAFHWFDPAATHKEFLRIGKKEAYTVLIWNERQVISPFEGEYEAFLRHFATDYQQVDHRNITPEKIGVFFGPRPFLYRSFYNEQRFDFPGLKGRLLSSSYIPAEGQPRFQEMISALVGLFEKYQDDGKILLEYETKVFAGKLR